MVINLTDKQIIQNALELLTETIDYILNYKSDDYTRGYIEATEYAIKLLTLNEIEINL